MIVAGQRLLGNVVEIENVRILDALVDTNYIGLSAWFFLLHDCAKNG